MLAAGLAGCGHDPIVPAADPAVTRQTAADSIPDKEGMNLNIAIDTAWAGQTHINF